MFTFLPEVIIEIIKDFIPASILVFLNKTLYFSYHHHIIKNMIPCYNMQLFIRKTIRQDHEFVFMRIVSEKFMNWFLLKNYQNGNTVYANYLYFIKTYCVEHESYKCWKALNVFLKKLGLCQNQHKKIITRNIKWKR
jgi:hypothetical protein